MKTSGTVTRIIALDVSDRAHFHSLFDDVPPTVDQLTPPPSSPVRPESDLRPLKSQVKMADVKMGQLGRAEKGELVRILRAFCGSWTASHRY